MIKSLFLSGILVLACGAATMTAQVTIGADQMPQPFSVLELINYNTSQNKGLRLPQVRFTSATDSTNFVAQLKTATIEAQGLEIFNLKTRCINTWNGTKWIETCPPEGHYVLPVSPIPPDYCGITPSTGSNRVYTVKPDPEAELYEFFVNGVSQGMQSGNVLTLSAPTASVIVTVAYLYQIAFLKPKMLPVPGNKGAVWKHGDVSSLYSEGTGVGNPTTVEIPDFKMAETPVTQAQFEYVMGPDIYIRFRCGGSFGSNVDYSSYVTCRPTSTLPVEAVSWYDAITYCNKLSLLEGKTPCYSIPGIDTLNLATNGLRGWKNMEIAAIPINRDANWDAATCNYAANGYRLPTESEWEYAARGGTADKHPVFSGSAYIGAVDYIYSGQGMIAADSLTLVGWHIGNNGSGSGCAEPYYGPKAVKGKRANVFGLYDMSGNVQEWCQEWQFSPTATPTIAVASASTSLRPVRGGSWYSQPLYTCRVSYHSGFDPYSRLNMVGFRVVLGH